MVKLSLASWLLLAAASLACVRAQEFNYPRYSPCAPATGINRNDPFVIGIAYWPGGLVDEWGNANNNTREDSDTDIPGLNPCIGDVSVNGSIVNYQDTLNSEGVLFSTFSVKTDTMTALRTTRWEEDLMWTKAKASPEQVISVVAFRNNIRSEAQYMRSSSPLTGGQGVVERLGLIATLDRGELVQLEWYNFNGCTPCGGTGSGTCITSTDQESCATSLAEPECKACTSLDCGVTNCSTTTLMAFRGSSKSGQALQSSFQLTQAFRYSISDVIGGLITDADDLAQVDTSGSGLDGGGSPPEPTTPPAPDYVYNPPDDPAVITPVPDPASTSPPAPEYVYNPPEETPPVEPVPTPTPVPAVPTPDPAAPVTDPTTPPAPDYVYTPYVPDPAADPALTEPVLPPYDYVAQGGPPAPP